MRQQQAQHHSGGSATGDAAADVDFLVIGAAVTHCLEAVVDRPQRIATLRDLAESKLK
jgi:hypothetical protein